MKKAALYIRVSTNHQIDKDSLPFQRQELINYSKYVLGIEDYEIFEDAGYSGKNTIRPAYQDMMSRIRLSEFSHIIVWKIDRISRNLLDFSDMYQELKDYGVSFISKNEQFDTSNAMGEAMLKIILVFAELERQMTSERVSKIMLDRATKGLWNGAPCPLGYRWDDKKKFPTIDNDEAMVITHIYNVYEETESTVKVMQFLNSNKYRTKRGGKWTTKVIADIIRNPFYKGTYRYNYRESARGKKKKEDEWILVDNNHEAIISIGQWDICNKIMDENAKRNVAMYRGKMNIHVLSGLLKCGECSSSYSSKLDRARSDGYRPSLYICLNRNNGLGCKAKILSEINLGSFIFNYISNMVNITKVNKRLTLNEFEQLLMKGSIFSDLLGLTPTSLENIYYKYLYPSESKFTKHTTKKETIFKKDTSEIKNEKNKLIRALERLESLFLFSDAPMSEKKYLLKTKELEEKIKLLDNQINENQVASLDNKMNDIVFIKKASYFIMINEISNKTSDINYKDLDMKIEKQVLRDFILNIIEKIIIKDNKIDTIIFKDGLEHKFIYKSCH